ncbi:MAG: DUF3568 family protein [Burkholderiales bacterium]
MRFIRILLLLFLTLAMTGCAAIATGLVSVGAGFGVSHHMSGTSQRTFSLPLVRVKTAAIAALKRMGIQLDSAEKTKSGEILKGTASGRKIEVELEAITPTATRMSSVAMKNGGWVLDSATGQEIVAQTEKILGRQSATPPARVPAS